MLFADLVAASSRAADAPARHDKVTRLSAFLRGRSPAEASTIAELLLRAQLFPEPDESTDDTVDVVDPSDQPSLTCDDVADAIGEIDRAPAFALRRSLIHQLLARATSEEQRWITSAVDNQRLDRPTFDLIVSSSARTAQVPVGSLRRAATLSGSLPLAVRIAFERGEAGLQSVAFEPGRPIPPTLAEVTETPDFLLDQPSPSLVERNLDADRIQVHRRRGEVMVFDQQLNDVTEAVPAVVEQVASFPRGDLVLDGWVDISPEAQSASRAAAGWTRRADTEHAPGHALFFDVLFDGAPVVDEPLSVRRDILASIVPERSQVQTFELAGLDDIEVVMNDCHEGLIVKPLDEPYEGGLVKSTWRMIAAAHIVNLAVIGADRGTGARSHLLSSVHLAARDDRDRFQEVARTARGLSLETIVWQTGVFARLMMADADGGSGGQYRLRPEIVAVVAIDGIEEPDPHLADLTLRNPRVVGYRESSEKGVTTVQALQDIADRERQATAAPVTTAADGLDLHDLGDGSPALPRLPPTSSAPTPAHSEPDADSTAHPVHESLTLAMGSRPQSAKPVRRVVAGVDFEPYREPVMLTSRRRWHAVVVARVTTLIWVAAILVDALVERSGSGDLDGGRIEMLGYIGFLVVALTVLTGWAWTDQLVRNLIRLDGRKPSRVRCVSAWLIPPVVVVLLAIVIVPIEPTEPADVRPAVIAVLFGFVMWRPYALIRRILKTLTRTRSDTLIASAYIIDALAFGILWWRFTQWAQRSDPVSRGDVDILVGTVGAVTIAMALSLIVWVGLLRTADAALLHRRTSQRTRYEHRMLRLRGVDPSDPEVWWALVQRRADEQREAEAARQATADADTAHEEHRSLPTVDDLLEHARSEHSVAFRRLGDEESLRLENRLREEFSAIVAKRASGQDPADRFDIAAALDSEPALTLPDRQSDDATPVPTGATEHSPAAASTRGDEDPIEALRRRTANRTNEPTTDDLEVLISRAGSLQIEAALAEHRNHEQSLEPAERMVAPKLYGVESIRLLMVTMFGALTLVTGWLVTISLSAEVDSETSELPASALDDLDLAREIFWSLLTIGFALVPLWSLVVIRQARRANVDVPRERRVRVLVVVALAAGAAGFVFDGDRGWLTLVLAIPIVWSAVAAGLCVEPVRVALDLPASTLTAWIATLPAILGVAWLAGLSGPVEPTASLQRLAFTTILLAFGCARVTVISVLSTVDLEDEFRVLPELAVPAGKRRRR